MRTSLSRLTYPLMAMMLLGGVGLAGAASSTATPQDDAPRSAADAVKPASNRFTKTLVQDLTDRGLEVTQGYPRLWSMDDCKDGYPVTFNCYGNNPASPYILSAVRPWPDEYVDPATADAFGRTRPGYSTTYRMDPREAVVVFGTMPPPGKYLGFQSYVFTHEWVVEQGEDPTHPYGYPWIQDAAQGGRDRFKDSPMVDYLFGALPRNERRVQSFSSVGNSINNVVMDGGPSGKSFGEVRYFVITPDRAMDETVRAALGRLGVTQEDVFTEPIPSSTNGVPLGPLGLDEGALDFMHGLRYAMPENEHAAQAWRAKLPLTVLRIREAPSSDRPAEPYGDIPKDPREAEDESDLQGDLQSLAAALTARATGGPWNLNRLPAPSMGAQPFMGNVENWLGHYGPRCRTIGENCLGDGQDASYFFMPPQPLDSGQVYAVLGTLGTQTGNATYNGLSINDASLLKGVANIPDHDPGSPGTDLEGSADGYSAVENRDKFFVHFFTRDCDVIAGLTDGACTTVTEEMVPPMTDVSAPGNPRLHGFFTAGLRSYVKPGSARGPITVYGPRDPATGQPTYASGQMPPIVLAFNMNGS